jgi:hypothetical protein
MADNKWHLVSTFDRTQTLEDFCNSIRFTIYSDEKYIYRIRDGIEANEQVKKKNWYRITINDDDNDNVGKVATYDSGSWKEDPTMSKEINLRNNTAYWMYGEKENSTNVWGVTGKGSGEMKWEKILLNIQRIGSHGHDFQLTIYGDTRGFRSFNGTFTSEAVIDPSEILKAFNDSFFTQGSNQVPIINTVNLNDNSFQNEFEYAKNVEGKVKVSFPFTYTDERRLDQIVSNENETADDFFTRIFKQMILYKNESLPNVAVGSDFPQRGGDFISNSCSKGLPFTIIFNKDGLEDAYDGYNINMW